MMIPRSHRPIPRFRAGFTVIEVIVAAGLLGLGLLSIVRVFPLGLRVAQEAEDVTRASILARTMFEGLKASSRDFPIIPGDPVTLIPIPGNGFDDDNDWTIVYQSSPDLVDLNGNGRPDVDFDGLSELTHLLGNGVDDDGDGIIDDTGDGIYPTLRGANLPHGVADGNLWYDPEPRVDEEWCNGKDDDGDRFIDEDCRLASSFQVPLSRFVRSGNFANYPSDSGWRPLVPGDGMDNDANPNGEQDEKRTHDPANPYVFDSVNDANIRRANGLDDDKDGAIDEGIDDRIYGVGIPTNWTDTQMARFPWSPMRFPAPNHRYAWQIFTGPVSDTDIAPELASLYPERYRSGNIGDGVDNDGDGLVDEEMLDGIDNDGDGRIDEDCIASPLPGWLKVVIVISWGGDGLNNDAVPGFCEGPTNPAATPPTDPKEFPNCSVAPDVDLTRFTLDYPVNLRAGGGLRSRTLPDYGHIAWGVDEELLDGIDNDLDGLVDEDVHLKEFRLVGFISLRDRTRSFPVVTMR